MVYRFILLLTLIYGCRGSRPVCRDNWNSEYDKDTIHFVEWMETYGKNYESREELKYRFDIWRENMRKIEKHNTANVYEFSLEMNHLGAELWPMHCNAMRNGVMEAAILNEEVNRELPIVTTLDLPTSVDWRKQDVVTPVKNQQQCGSCWAFSATGSMEGAHALKTGNLVSLSESQIVDCDVNASDEGCNGGWMDGAFQYAIQKGMESESKYPYEPFDGNCTYQKRNIAANFTRFQDVKGGEVGLQKAVAQIGPISVAIDASSSNFQFYKNGVYYGKDCSKTMLDHGVLVVGYGTTNNGTDYWIVKNSWGNAWGDNGYILMSRNRDNNCGIATKPSYPIV